MFAVPPATIVTTAVRVAALNETSRFSPAELRAVQLTSSVPVCGCSTTVADPAGSVIGGAQSPFGADPAGTVTVCPPTVKVKFVPTDTPVPAILQISS